MQRHSRKPASAVLLLALLASAAMLVGGRSAGGTPDDAGLTELQRLIAAPDAPPEAWQSYAQRLQQLQRHQHAAEAWIRFLHFDPYNRQARLQACVCLAAGGDAEAYLAFLKEVVLADPKLAVEVLDRPDSAKYLTDPQFQALANEAKVQSMD